MAVVKLGAFNHIGLVVKNIEETAAFYNDIFGIGPFTVDTYHLKDIKYRGKPTDASVRGAFGFQGDLMIELVEVVEGKTPHTEFMEAKGEGVQHIGFPVDDMEASLKALAKKGIVPILEYQFIADAAPVSDPDPESRRPMQVWEAYLDTEEKAGGVVIQLMELKEISADSEVTYVANPGRK